MGVTNDTRDRMIVSAALLLREHGVAGTSFARVLEHSGGPRGSVGFHFPDGKRELVVEAIRWAGGFVTRTIAKSASDGVPAAEVFGRLCDFYRRELVASDYLAGCPVGAVAQESHADAELRAVVAEVLADWRRGLVTAVRAEGHGKRDAEDLVDLGIAAVEGAILMARVDRSTRPLDVVERRMRRLLAG